MNDELKGIIKQFADCEWGVIDAPSKAWLADDSAVNKNNLIEALKTADKQCGMCGCDFDGLYKRALTLLRK